MDGHDYLFDLDQDQRERANQAKVQGERLDSMRMAWEAWERKVPAIPPEAAVSLGYSVADMPQR